MSFNPFTPIIIPGECFRERFKAFVHYPETKIVEMVEIVEVDFVQGTIASKHTISKCMNIFTILPNRHVAIAASIHTNQENGVIDLYKVTIDHGIPQKIISICELFGNDPKILADRIEHYKLIGINERNALLFIVNHSFKYGIPFYKKILLIDSIESKYYIVPPEISPIDQLYRLDDIRVFLGNNKFYLKTGRIMWKEKWDMWQPTFPSGPYFDHLESIVLYEVENFIKQVKLFNPIIEGVLTEQVDYNFAVKEIDIIENNLFYLVDNIPKKKSQLKIYDITTNTITVIA